MGVMERRVLAFPPVFYCLGPTAYLFPQKLLHMLGEHIDLDVDLVSGPDRCPALSSPACGE